MSYWKDKLWRGYTTFERRLGVFGACLLICAALTETYALQTDNNPLALAAVIVLIASAVLGVKLASDVRKRMR